jgi:pimeloyl-ACP methyl ester carboxylesterase
VTTTTAPGATPTATPGYVGPEHRARFVTVHHPPAATATGGALVIVPPFGYEAICAHRALRHLAEAAAAAGLLAIRLDLDGTGDSVGDDDDPDRVAAWLASIGDAADAARAAGASHVTLVGVRLGAALAIRAALGRHDVAGVVAIAPVLSGRRYLREGRALQLTLDLAPDPASDGAAPAPDPGAELVGFALTAETRAAITALELEADRAAPPAVLVLDRDDLPPSARWVAHLRGLGAEVAQRALPGYVEMVLDPHKALIPTQLVAAAVAFAAARRPRPAPAPIAAPRRDRAVVAPGVVERPVVLPAGVRAILSEPPTPAPTRTVLLLNAGAVSRVGPNRLHVALARRLAAGGDRVVRLDLTGLGDSPPRPGAEPHVVYGDHALADVDAAVGWARAEGARHVAVVGLCSGAYHAFKTAVRGAPIDHAVMLNPLTFFWVPGMSLEATPSEVAGETARLGARLRDLDAWKKVLRGEVDLRRVARVLGRRALGRATDEARDLARRLGIPLREDLGSELLAATARGACLTFILAESDPGYALLREGGGAVVPRLIRRGALRVERFGGPDHTFTARWTHPPLLDLLTAALTSRR